MQWSNNPTLF